MVLLVIDIQKGITNEDLYKFSAFIKNTQRIIDTARKNNIEVIYVQHDDGPGSDFTVGYEDYEIADQVKPLEGDKVFTKSVNSCFSNKDLVKYLEDKKEDTLIIIGLQTDYCIDSSIRSAFDRGYKVIVPNGANTTFDNEYMDRETTYKYYNEMMWPNRFAECVAVDDVIALMSNKMSQQAASLVMTKRNEQVDSPNGELNLEIKRLTPVLVEDYLHFFDITPHSEQPDSDDCKCYCVWWCGEDQTNEVFEQHLATKEKRRNYAKEKILEDKLQGYLAYCDNQVVGWCNTNTKSDCYNCFCWRNFMNDVSKDEPIKKVKSILCFAIAPEFRGKGVATKLLNQICLDAKIDGFEYIESYPNDNFQDQAHDYMGPYSMFKNANFKEYYKFGEKVVMRKKL